VVLRTQHVLHVHLELVIWFWLCLVDTWLKEMKQRNLGKAILFSVLILKRKRKSNVLIAFPLLVLRIILIL